MQGLPLAHGGGFDELLIAVSAVVLLVGGRAIRRSVRGGRAEGTSTPNENDGRKR